jgi:hypothetical protein
MPIDWAKDAANSQSAFQQWANNVSQWAGNQANRNKAKTILDANNGNVAQSSKDYVTAALNENSSGANWLRGPSAQYRNYLINKAPTIAAMGQMGKMANIDPNTDYSGNPNAAFNFSNDIGSALGGFMGGSGAGGDAGFGTWTPEQAQNTWNKFGYLADQYNSIAGSQGPNALPPGLKFFGNQMMDSAGKPDPTAYMSMFLTALSQINPMYARTVTPYLAENFDTANKVWNGVGSGSQTWWDWYQNNIKGQGV